MPYDPHDFVRRHIGPSPDDQARMLEAIGASSLDALIDQTVPGEIRQAAPLDIGPARSEHDMLADLREIAGRNRVLTSMIGQGYYGTLTPPVIRRGILENPAWHTAYTPYQAEISQGRLEALLAFQTMVADLTGLDAAGASLLDEATAAAEAMTMAKRVAKSKAKAFFADENLHPQTLAVLRTRAEPLGIDIIVGAPETLQADQVFGALFQYPGTYGDVRDFTPEINALHGVKAVAVMAADLLALTVLKSPAEMGADIAVGAAQRFGVPLGYGGPHAAYISCRDAYKRSLPGRIVGVSVDSRGAPAYRLALQTREQHIRREKATSNICTAQALLAVMAAMYAIYHGPEGLTAIAKQVHGKAVRLAKALVAAGYSAPGSFFDTVTVTVGDRQPAILAAAREGGVNLRAVGSDRVSIACDEATSEGDLETVAAAFGARLQTGLQASANGMQGLQNGLQEPQNAAHTAANADEMQPIADGLQRRSAILTHPIFHMGRSEAEMVRFMRRLADRDLALDRAMIPLGSCTMKLNAAAEMAPVTWPEFANLHPFAPADQAQGYKAMIDDLSAMLCAATGYDAMSMQPNSGAQGEYAGLMTIRAYHQSRGDAHRDVCLIPMSAHGTNPASAQMAGMTVIAVKDAENGDVDLADFEAKAMQYADRLAACMITYPSTHGVFETTVRQACEITHQHGGQVYIDGANMNAMVGLARPGDVGGDVSHLNLHKTFCIPHGGGGPGMGPIGVKAHLAPCLPGHPEVDSPDTASGAVAAAPFGSPSILPISWAYCRMMGGAGLASATKTAILNANYIAARLSGAYEVLYKGANDRVAHECILDVRPFADSAGVSVDDIAKRLIDYGFHAPTMSWPVSGTLMLEPTESEPKGELDRFINAMLAIREEIRAIEDGRISSDGSPLKHAPHTLADVMGDWDRAYERAQGAFPGGLTPDKYWPAVNRVDNVFGDRNLVCACPPMSDYAEAAE